MFALTSIILAKEPETVEKTFILTYINTQETWLINYTLKPMLSPAGSIKVDTEKNALTIRDIPAVLQLVEKELEIYDNPEVKAKRIVTSFKLFEDTVENNTLDYPITNLQVRDFFGFKYTASLDIDGVVSALSSQRKNIKLL